MLPLKLSSVIARLALIIFVLTACSGPKPEETPDVQPSPTPRPSPSPSPSPSDAIQEGDDLLKHSDFAGAADAFRRAIAIDPGSSPAYTGLSTVNYWEGYHSSESLANAEKAVELDPENASAHAILSRAQNQKHAVADGLKSAQKAAELDPENPGVQAALSRAYLANNQFEEARQAAQKAYALDPGSAEAVSALGVYYESTAEFGRARAAYELAASLEPEFAPWQVYLTAFYGSNDHFQEARQAAERALKISPEYLPALLAQAYTDIYSYEFEAARTRLESLEKVAPDQPEVFRAWGILNNQMGEYELALEQYEKALDLDPLSSNTQMLKAQTLLMQSECEQSRELFQEVFADHPENSKAQEGLGFAELCAGDVNKALTHFREAAKTNPYSPTAQRMIGFSYYVQQRWNEARDSYLEALRLDPAPANLHSLLGDYYWAQQLNDAAEAEFQLASDLNPYLVDAQLSQANLMMEQDRFKEASASIEEAAALDPDNPETLRLQGILAGMQDEPDQAVEFLQRALDEDPEEPYSHLYLGLAYRDLGDYQQASKEIQTYKALMGEGLPEDDGFRIDFLLEMLESGYLISEEKAITDMKDFIELLLEKPLQLTIDELEKTGRTVVVTLPLTQAEAAGEDYMIQVGTLAGLFSLYVPRIDPPVENGVEIRVTRSGGEPFLIHIDLDTLKQVADTTITVENMVQEFDYEMDDKPAGEISIANIAREIAELRQLELEQTPPFEKITVTGVQEHMEKSVDEQVHASMDRDEDLLTLLGVISPASDLEGLMVDLYNEQIAGFYTPEEGKIYLVEQDQPSAEDRLVIAHETTHALQDQAFGLEMISDEAMNDDQSLAVDALVEGDATLAMVNYMQEYVPQIEMLDLASQAGALETEALEAAPDFISNMVSFPYSAGIEFVQAIFNRGGWEAVNQVYTDLPQSTEQILHPDRYQDQDGPLEVDLPDLEQTLGEGWQEVDRDVLGEYSLRLILAEYMGPLAAEQAAEGWGGDGFVLLENSAEGKDVFVLETTWDDSEEADDFWDLFQAAMYHRPEYHETVEDLVGELTTHTWQSEANSVLAARDGEEIFLLIGPDLEVLKQVLTTVSPASGE